MNHAALLASLNDVELVALHNAVFEELRRRMQELELPYELPEWAQEGEEEEPATKNQPLSQQWDRFSGGFTAKGYMRAWDEAAQAKGYADLDEVVRKGKLRGKHADLWGKALLEFKREVEKEDKNKQRNKKEV